MNAIETLFNVVCAQLAAPETDSTYYDVTDTLTRLADKLHRTDTDETVWHLGEYGEYCLSDLIIGAYWHYTEWHGGQYSPGYLALCALGAVYTPNMASGPEPDSSEEYAYQVLNDLAKRARKPKEEGMR